MYGEKKMKKSKKITGIAGATLIGTTVFYLKTRRKAKKERTKKEQIQQKENQQEQKKQSQKKSIPEKGLVNPAQNKWSPIQSICFSILFNSQISS